MASNARASVDAPIVSRPSWRPRSGSAWTVVGTGAVVIVLLVAVTVAVALRRRNIELRDAARELRTLDLALAAETARSFQSVELVLDNVADQLVAGNVTTPEGLVERASTKAVYDLLRARVAVVPQLDAVTIVSAAGKLINFSRYWPIPDVDLKDRDYFRALRDGTDTLFLSEPVLNRGSGTPTIYLARRLGAPDGSFLGLVLGAVELGSFERLYASLELGPSNLIALWRRDGVLLARYPMIDIGRRVSPTAITAGSSTWHGVTGVFETTWSFPGEAPEARVIASQATPGFPIQVNLGRSERAILGDWRREVTGIGLAVGLAVLSVLGLVWALLRRFNAYEAVADASRERELAVAARERAEAAKEAAEDANRAKSAFLANMSHELRTPLSAVIGYTEMLEEQAEDTGQSEMLADLGKVKSNARHLLGLINDVLDLSKIEAARMDTYAEPFDVANFVRDAAASVETLVHRRSNTLVLDLGDALGAMHSDVTKLRQCLFNLLSNASKFTENGRIVVRVSRAFAPDGDRLAFAVADTGIGMTPEQLGRLFQRFSQADETTTRKFGGTGLGLALTRAFARLLGGDVTVESAPGTGTTFTLTVPAVLPDRNPAEEAPPAEDPAAEASRELVLVIDDEASPRNRMMRFLRRQGFAVRAAADGERGLQLARTLQPRLVLLDVVMPGLDGWSVLAALKADPATARIPVVLVSVVADATLGAALGATDVVPKPIDWAAMTALMDRFRGGDVLVVDDDADARGRLRAGLEEAGFSVAEADGGSAALDRVRAAPPHVILLDLTVPVTDGFAFLHRLRDMPGGADIPVVVLSARDLSHDERERLAGADAVVAADETGLGDLTRTIGRLEDQRESAAADAGR